MFAYIPARSGSKRIKNKNIRLLNNKPILQIVIENLKQLSFIKKIYVSTDSLKIANIARKNGAETLELRSSKLSDSKSGFIDLIKNDIPRFVSHINDKEVLFVLSTAALVPPKIFRDSHKIYKKINPEVLMPCDSSKPFWSLVKIKNKWKPLFNKEIYKNSQDLPKSVIDSGLFYYFNIDKIKKYDSLKNVSNLHVYNVPSIYSIDVDTEIDWKNLKQRFELLNG